MTSSPTPPRIVIADDFTGACDSAVHFAAAGMRTALLLNRSALAATAASHETIALATESRFLPPDAAAQAAGQAAAATLETGGEIAFKKIDSTLRGNPGAEIEAVMDAGGFQAALICPAMPKTGRTCRDGVLLVDGVPLHQTGMGKDPVNPVKTGKVAAILSNQSAAPTASLTLAEVRAGRAGLRGAAEKRLAEGARFLVADAETDSDMQALGGLIRELRPLLLPAGAGGLAEALVGKKRPAAPEPLTARMLAVAGSLTAETREQVARAAASGAFCLLPLDMGTALKDPDAETDRLLSLAKKGDGKHLLLSNFDPPETGTAIDAFAAERAAEIFASAAGALCRAEGCGLVYASGGATAVAVAAELGLGSVTLVRELMPGVVLSSCWPEGRPARWFVSKAGGFGGADTLVRLSALCSP